MGFGTRGRQWKEAIDRRRDLELVGVVEPEPLAAAAAGKAGLAQWSSLEQALDDRATECALVASPPWLHVEQTVELVRAGVAVLVEKPLALSFTDAAAIAREAEKADRPVLVGQNFRYIPREIGVRRALERFSIGSPFQGSMISGRPLQAAAAHLAAVPHGPLWDICIHHLDALRARFDQGPVSVAAQFEEYGDAGSRRYELLLRWNEGSKVRYGHSEGAPAYHHYEWFEGAERGIAVDGQRVSIWSPDRRPRRVAVRRAPRPEAVILDQLVAALDDGAPPELGVAGNLETVALVDAAVRSIDQGREVSLSEISELPAASVSRGGAHDGAI